MRVRLLWLLPVLGPLAALYCSIGLYTLVCENPRSFPIDLRLRWFELGLMYDGRDPQEGGSNDPVSARSHPGVSLRGSEYPPWAYATAMLLIPPLGWGVARAYFGAANAAALAVIGFWAYRTARGRQLGRPDAALCVSSVLAIFSFAICLSYGQYTVFVTACLCGCLMLWEEGRDTAAGVCLGMAMIKPHLAAIFFLPLLVARRFRVLGVAAAYLAAASCLTWALSGRDPIRMLAGGMGTSGRVLSPRAHNYLILMAKDLLGGRTATVALAGAGAAACLLLLLWKKNYRDPLLGFSICSVISMYWSYRKHYDCVLLVFPLAGLLLLGLRTGSRAAVAAFLLFGVSLWAPLRDAQWRLPAVFLGHAAIWISGLAVLVSSADRAPQGTTRSPPPA